MSESPVIHVQGLVRTYGANTAVDGLDLSVAPGECLGLLGPNGAGKTTTIKILSTALKPTEGHVRVFGLDPVEEAAALRGKIGVVPQEIALYGAMTARENLDFFGGMYGLTGSALKERSAWALDVAGLAYRADEYVEHYSGGMKRRLNLVASLLHKPDVVFLDEPTVGVDPQSRNHLFEVIEREIKGKATLVYTTHQLGEVERLCDRIAILDNGRLVSQGTLPELQAAARAASGGSGLELEPGVDLDKAAGVLRDAGFRVRVADGAPSLEDVFLALTGKALRDES
jgi:ABC-2 type transport system ATP-binding protein